VSPSNFIQRVVMSSRYLAGGIAASLCCGLFSRWDADAADGWIDRATWCRQSSASVVLSDVA